MRPSRIRSILPGLLSFVLTACSLNPQYTRPALPVPETVGLPSPDSADAGMPGAGPRDFFRDRRLLRLMEISLEQNRDLRLAVLAVTEAAARYGLQRANSLPRLEAQGSGEYTGRFTGRNPNSYSLTGMPSFEPDLFGRLRSLNEAEWHRYLATAEAAKVVRISLVARVAQAYLAERLADELHELAERTLESRQASRAFIEHRLRSGESSLQDLEQARSLVEAGAAEVAAQEEARTRARHALDILSGGFVEHSLPEALPLLEQELAPLPRNIPSAILLRRPDVMEAERLLQAANADIGAARAAFFPSISLTGQLGYMSEDLGALFLPGTSLWSFLPKITLPVFSGGRNAANLELAEIRKESSVLQYEKAIQNAFREVADALLTRESLAGQLAARQRYLDSQRLVLGLAMSNYVNGAARYLEVLDAQRGVFDAERSLLAVRRDQLANDTALYAALGGGGE
jgi:Cu(I)/Ag(I) efflux system outer membrane protein